MLVRHERHVLIERGTPAISRPVRPLRYNEPMTHDSTPGALPITGTPLDTLLHARAATAELADERGVVDIRIDHDRADRCGFPEVVFAQGKTGDQVARAITEVASRSGHVLVTRVGSEHLDHATAAALEIGLPLVHHERARILELGGAAGRGAGDSGASHGEGLIVIATGGTSDVPVAEEAAVVAEAMGARVERLFDVGVAGVHRALESADTLRAARVVIAVAGMEGALPTLVAGLVNVPVIAVPTSVGYGANLDGFAPLLTMLNSCAAGIGVVNIDNGYGAAVLAARINSPAVAASSHT